MPLTIGSRIGAYEISGLLGIGGMGEVYRARDTRLNRDVALKVLPAVFAQDQERMARFEREAQVLASLNHPSIAAIYGLEDSSQARALVMELAEGPTLADRISQAAIPIDEALAAAKQIAEALEYAHERNIVHRDLKPANVKITADGRVKLLDFGLAKALEVPIASGQSGVAALTQSPTITAMGTQAGVILGTAQYMSPEQARGKAADRRADIWAFGVVLYEMLAGKELFGADTPTDVLVAVLTREPDWLALPAATPARIGDLLRRCLQRSPRNRLHDIADARIEIEEALGTLSKEPAVAVPKPPSGIRLINFLPWALFVLTLAFGAWVFLQPRAPVERLRARVAVPLPESARIRFMVGSSVALSPDGSTLVYAGSANQLFVRPLDSGEPAPLRGSEYAHSPFFSPDGQWVGYFGGGSLKKVPVKGGLATVLSTAATGHGGSWGSDGSTPMIVYAPTPFSGLMRVSPDGGTPRPLTTLAPGERSHRWPQILPDGTAVIFTVCKDAGFENASIAAFSLRTGQRRTLVDGGGYGRYVTDHPGSGTNGCLVWAQVGELLGAPLDPTRLQVTGPAVVLQDGVASNPNNASAQFGFSDAGSLAYVAGGVWDREVERALVWVNREGITRRIGAAHRSFENPRLSPDGRRVASAIRGAAGRDLWILDVKHDSLTRVTFGSDALLPVWTPDGTRLTYCSDKGEARPNLFWVRADGSGPEERLSSSEHGQYPSSWAPDGRSLLFSELNPNTRGDIWVFMLGDRKARPFVRTPFDESAAMFSPDGRWVSYQSNESGRDEIYVQPFPGPGGKWQISTEGGSVAVWARNGRELFYRQGDRLMVVDVKTGSSLAFSKPRLLFEGLYERGFFPDPSPDAREFLMIPANGQVASSSRIELVFGSPHERIAGLPGK